MGLFSKKSKTEKIYRRPEPQPAETLSTSEQQGRNNYIIVILDSCRYDAFVAAQPRTIKKLGELEKRYSYASWTAPSHYNLLMGLLPHSSPKQVYASEYYKKDFLKFNERFGVDGFEFKNLVPQMYIPSFMREKLGYKTHAKVSMPVLNPHTPVNTGFDTFKLMESHNNMAAMLDEMTFSEQHPSFYLLNVGETHYPYATPLEPENEWPRIHGVHGVFKHATEPLDAFDDSASCRRAFAQGTELVTAEASYSV